MSWIPNNITFVEKQQSEFTGSFLVKFVEVERVMAFIFDISVKGKNINNMKGNWDEINF